MNWTVILTTVAAAGIGAGTVVAAIAWLAKSLIGQVLEKRLERFKASIKADGEKEIEHLKASLELAAQKKIIEFGSLHNRRAEIIAEFYEKLTEVQRLSQVLPWNLILREYKEEYGQAKFNELDQREAEDVRKLSTAWREMSEFYRKRKLYFKAEVCDQIERVQAITGFISDNYHNIAYRDEHGEIYVHPQVKQVWDASHEALPKIMAQLEAEFRTLLGVT